MFLILLYVILFKLCMLEFSLFGKGGGWDKQKCKGIKFPRLIVLVYWVYGARLTVTYLLEIDG